MASTKLELFRKRRMRVRNKLKSVNAGRLRLSVHRSNKNISVQLIDDAQGRTVASASTLEPILGSSARATSRRRRGSARRSPSARKAAGVTEAYFDRGGFLFHGRVKALADAARDAGLKI